MTYLLILLPGLLILAAGGTVIYREVHGHPEVFSRHALARADANHHGQPDPLPGRRNYHPTRPSTTRDDAGTTSRRRSRNALTSGNAERKIENEKSASP